VTKANGDAVVHPATQLADVLAHDVHTPLATTYPGEHAVDYGALHALVPGKHGTHDDPKSVN